MVSITGLVVNIAGFYSSENDGVLRVNDAMGRLVFSRTLATGNQSITLPASLSGMYYYSIQNNKGQLTSGKLIIQ